METIEGFLFYLILCWVSLLAGTGILQLLRIPLPSRIRLTLSPVITLCFWTLFLGVGVLLGYAGKQLCWMGWLGTIGVAGFSLRKALFADLYRERLLLGMMFLLPVAIMFPNFWYGLKIYLGSNLPDGWSYIAQGQYLWEYPRGLEGGLAPLYQYAAHLNSTRYISSALLGFFSPFSGVPGDTQAVSGIFQAWTLFTFSSTCLFFARTRNLPGNFLFFYASLCVFSGWTLRLLWTNNFDNALALSFLPALGGVIHIAEPQDRRWSLLLAPIAAATLYAYPEMAPFILAGGFLFFLPRFFLEDKKGYWGLLLLCALFLTVLLVAPFFQDFMSFLRGQIAISIESKGIRPGEGYFPELLISGHQLYAWWGFARASTGGLILHFALGLILTLWAVVGALALIKRKDWGLLFTLVFLLLTAVLMTFWFRYSYGVYKIFLLIWWGVAFLATIGVERIVAHAHSKKILSTIAMVFFLIIVVHAVKFDPWGGGKKENVILKFKEVEKIKAIVHDQPVYVGVEDDLANEWAVYFLRNQLIYIAPYRVYMAQEHVIPYMKRARSAHPSKIRYVLSDERKNEFLRSGIPYNLVWKGGPYYLWQTEAEPREGILKACWQGFGNADFVQLSETLAPDGRGDAVFEVEIHEPGEIIAIELRNLTGPHSVWDTIPGNGHVLLGVADAQRSAMLLNQPDGSLRIPLTAPTRLLLYAADNSSIQEGKTKYQVTVFFGDGRTATAVVQGRG